MSGSGSKVVGMADPLVLPKGVGWERVSRARRLEGQDELAEGGIFLVIWTRLLVLMGIV
jgi:hypothetical protein